MKDKSKLHVCLFAEGYPTAEDPFMPFIRNTVAEIVRQGVDCTVIVPQSITREVKHKVPIRPNRWIDHIDDTLCAEILQPKFVTLSGKAAKINHLLFLLSAKKAYRRMNKSPDLLYGHFWHMGIIASKVDSSKPLFVACGESKISVCSEYKKTDVERMEEQLTGVIYVSTKSYEEAKELGLQRNKPYIIAPNGYDSSIFYQRSRLKCREMLGWPKDGFIISFVGAFIERKGTRLLSNALVEINKKQTVYSCFVGSGEEYPTCPNALYIGKVDHDQIPVYLNASDVFVLPTTNEGCCNAIIEAIACGLPIISSDASFNNDILDDHNSIRINPKDQKSIMGSILSLIDDPKKRKDMEKASLRKAERLTNAERISNIIAFLEKYT